MIEIKKLRELVKLMKDNDLSEIDLRDNDEQITLKRPTAEPIVTPIAAPVAPLAAAPAPVPAAPAAPAEAAGGAAPAPADDGLIEVTSPMVGTFYTAASPDADDFVSVGATVGEDTVVCIIEAMKVFNEIKAEKKGTVAKILVDSGQAVEFGQPLFLLKP